jgi:type II secretory pathway pseudopilin PulG
MASAGTSGSDKAIRAILALAILGLIVLLYFVTVVPAQKAAADQAATDRARQRMGDIRTALITFRDANATYPSTLDSLVAYARTDSTFLARANETERTSPLNLDSLTVSTRTGTPYLYEVNADSSGVQLYWLGDPDVPGDSIGARDPNPAYRNAASWE